ncbi:MAG: hypothetical protein DRJ47_06120 [Thermoprotei archaeon]|nr:MAG: hypothetical protein DRJ47_06120 [Thermoprotei archaeon]
MFNFLRRKKKEEVFQVFDPDGELVMSDVEPITKETFNQLIEANPDDFGPGKYVCMCNGEVIWTRTIREKVVKVKQDESDNDPLSAVKKSVEKINEEKRTLKEFKEALDEILGEGDVIDLSNAPTGVREGISKGMGAAMYKGLVDRSDETVDKVFGLMDAASDLMRGLGMWLYNNTGSPSDLLKKAGMKGQVRNDSVKNEAFNIKQEDNKFTVEIGGGNDNE